MTQPSVQPPTAGSPSVRRSLMISASGDGSVGDLMNLMIYEVVAQRASDIHIEPFKKVLRVKYRVDGMLYEISAEQLGDVDLEGNIELSRIVNGPSIFGNFIFDPRTTTTQVAIKDGQTTVISGIVEQEDFDEVRKLPLLGDLPLLGGLFRATDRVARNREWLERIRGAIDVPQSHEANPPIEPLPVAPAGSLAQASASDPDVLQRLYLLPGRWAPRYAGPTESSMLLLGPSDTASRFTLLQLWVVADSERNP